MQSGSMARAASAAPMSATSQPNSPSMALTLAFACALLPQINIVGFSSNEGLYIKAFPTHENAFTKCAEGAMSCSRFISDSFILVKKLSAPFTGMASAMGLHASIIVLPAKFAGPQLRITSSATVPLTASSFAIHT
jgi:hypothetical protein